MRACPAGRGAGTENDFVSADKWSFGLVLTKVLVLGATGHTGRATTRTLATSDVATETVAAGRNLEAARRVVTELGPKATPLQLDASDAGSVATAAADVDILVYAAGPDARVHLPFLRWSIDFERSGPHPQGR